MITIDNDEIENYTKKLFIDNGDEIICKHNPMDGERDFVLCIIEQIIGLLSHKNKNDKMIIQHTKNLLCVSNESLAEYTTYLDYFAPSEYIKKKGLESNKLNTYERKVLKQLMESNLNEYLMKNNYVQCCYSAMNAFLIAAYCILYKGINTNVDNIRIVADIYDQVQAINIKEDKKNIDNIYVEWHSTNKINNLYMLYKTQYYGLSNSSILDLVSADVIEEDYYLKDDRFTIAPSILMKQYLSIIEREVNSIIQLAKLDNTPNRHLNWYDMKNFVRRRGINIDFLSFKLYKALDDLYQFRNVSMHGEIDISKKDYEIMQFYKNSGLFQGLSVKKLELQNIILHPTVDEIGEYMGYKL